MRGELSFTSTIALAEEIRARRVTAAEVLETFIAQVDRHNPTLNAIVTRDEEAARHRAAEADAAIARGRIWGPLHGVPITVKDAYETIGMRTTASHKPLSGHVPSSDAAVVARLRAAGAIIWGKTNMPELAMDFQSQSPIFGRANNPFDVGRTPGGSSGGGAAAVAAGFTPFEVGSDIAGSIRIPAHFCGIYGFKPTENRLPMAGHIPGLPGAPRGVRHMGSPGLLARTVGDLRLVFSVLAGADGGVEDVEVAPVPLAPPGAPMLAGLRFAWTDDFGGVRASAATRDALEQLASLLARCGARVVRRSPPHFDFASAWARWGELLGAEVAGSLALPDRLGFQLQFLSMSGRDPLALGVVRGAGFSMRQYAQLLTRRDEFIAELERFLGDWDAWLCPVATVPAIRHMKPGGRVEIDGAQTTYMSALGAYTSVFNLTGSPVVVLPLGQVGGGLPLGVQVVGRRWRDMELLNVAESIAAATGGYRRPPGY